MNPLERVRHWTLRLPNVWGLGQAEIHSSLLIMLGVLALLTAGVGFSRPGFEELIPVAMTLPVVWVLSLAVRVAAQQLVLGESSIEMETTVGPTGNLSTDYEYLPPKRILVYALAGQLATLGLALLGFTVSAALVQAGETPVTSMANLFDLKGGWRSEAWASQIMWVNLFLSVLHLLPTVPFDSRAVLFAVFSFPHRMAQEPHVFRRLATLVSHLATFMLGIGLSTMVTSLVLRQEILGWYAAVAAAVYLFVAGRWESSRAEELEEQYAPVLHRHSRHQSGVKSAHLQFGVEPGNPETGRKHPARRKTGDEALAPVDSSAAQSAADAVASEFAEQTMLAGTDIDEILRKLHREGRDALSDGEQQALLSASRELNARRSQTK